jgi:hypothetical protein
MARQALLVALLLARPTRQAHFARIALATVLIACTRAATAALLLAPLSVEACGTTLRANSVLVAFSAEAIFGTTDTSRSAVLEQAWKPAATAAMWQARVAVAAAHGMFWALFFTFNTAVTFFDTFLAIAIRFEAHTINAAVCTWARAFAVPPLVWVTISWSRAALVAVSCVLVTAWIRRLLAIVGAFVCAFDTPVVVIALIDARTSR